MGIEDIKKKLNPEMLASVESPDFKTTDAMIDGVMKLYENEDAENGDCLRWTSVDISLKPEIYLLTGIPSSGKSTWLDNVIMNSIKMHEYRWAVFSPESHPVELHLKQMIEIYTGTNFYGHYHYQRTSVGDLNATCSSLRDHLFMLTPTDENLTIEGILSIIEYLIENHGVNSFVLDPYNEFSHTRPNNMTETEYVSRFLGKVRRFVNKHNVMAWIVAHPTKMRKEEIIIGGSTVIDYPCPTAYDVAGSANFFNKPDNIIAVHRDKDISRNPDNEVSINVQKVRRKTTGKLGSYLLKFNYNDGTYRSA